VRTLLSCAKICHRLFIDRIADQVVSPNTFYSDYLTAADRVYCAGKRVPGCIDALTIIG
jgi:hypothetical protein